MAITKIGGGSVPITKMEALANELRLLKAGMADMQGRLEALLVEIGTELQHMRAESEPSAEALPEALPDRQVDAPPQESADLPDSPAAVEAPLQLEAASDAASSLEQADIVPAISAETEVPAPSADEPMLMHAVVEPVVAALQTAVVEGDEPAAQIEMAETTETAIAPDAETFEPNTPAEPAHIEATDVVALAEPTTQTPVAAEADEITAEMAAEPIALADLRAEPLIIEAQAVEIAADGAPLRYNVVALAERRTAPRKGRTVIARAARWAAVIVLIVVGVAIAATGTGFAGQGELLILDLVCALAGESCSIILGIP